MTPEAVCDDNLATGAMPEMLLRGMPGPSQILMCAFAFKIVAEPSWGLDIDGRNRRDIIAKFAQGCEGGFGHLSYI